MSDCNSLRRGTSKLLELVPNPFDLFNKLCSKHGDKGFLKQFGCHHWLYMASHSINRYGSFNLCQLFENQVVNVSKKGGVFKVCQLL